MIIVFLKFLCLLALLCCSAFFSASEAAIFHLPVITIDKFTRRYKRLRILKRRELLLGTILFGNTLVNVGASLIAQQIVMQLFHNSYIGILTGVMTYIILVCGEITPKLYSLRNAEAIAIKTTPILNFLRYVFSPITLPLEAIISFLTPKYAKGFTKDEFHTFIESEEKLSKGAKAIIFNLMEFKKFTAEDLMTPLPKLECLENNIKLTPELIKTFFHSKIPVYESASSNIKGILYTKDCLKIKENKSEQSIASIMRIPIFIESSMKANEVLTKFRRRHTRIAIVLAQKKEISAEPVAIGIITVEDILKVIVN